MESFHTPILRIVRVVLGTEHRLAAAWFKLQSCPRYVRTMSWQVLALELAEPYRHVSFRALNLNPSSYFFALTFTATLPRSPQAAELGLLRCFRLCLKASLFLFGDFAHHVHLLRRRVFHWKINDSLGGEMNPKGEIRPPPNSRILLEGRKPD